jgi:hypothetical protein
MTLSLPINRRIAKCVPAMFGGASAVYLLNEGAGQVANDRSGNGHHGTLGSTPGADTNDPAWGTAGLTNGADDYTDLGVVPYDPTALSAFVVCKGDAQDNTWALCRYDTGLNARCWGIGTGITAGGFSDQVTVTVSDDGTLQGHGKQYVAAPTTFGDGLYHMIGFTFDAGALQVYIDGAAVATTAPTYDVAITTIYNPADVRTTLGSRLNSGATAGNFQGEICLAAVFPSALSASWVYQLYVATRTLMAARGVTLV